MNYAISLIAFISIAVLPAMPEFPHEIPTDSQSLSRSFLQALIQRKLEHSIPRRTPGTRNTRIIGGTPATPNQFPYQVAIYVRNFFEGYDFQCGGIIYDATHIITTAHCLRGLHYRNLKVIAGEHELAKDEGPEQYRDILGYIFHQQFNPVNSDNDIGIITLDWPLDLNENIKPLRLPKNVTSFPEMGRHPGWGSDGVEDGPQNKLLFVDLQIYTRAKCIDDYVGRAEITEGMICAGDDEGVRSTCLGDSGGGLICKDESDSEYLCGVMSWGMLPCGLPQFPSVFTNINHYLDWLHGLLPPQEISS